MPALLRSGSARKIVKFVFAGGGMWFYVHFPQARTLPQGRKSMTYAWSFAHGEMRRAAARISFPRPLLPPALV